MLQTHNVRSTYFARGKFRTSLIATDREPTLADDFFLPNLDKTYYQFPLYYLLNS